jgi:hypothetical protein
MKITFSSQHQDMLLLKWPVLLLVISLLAIAVWCVGVFQFRQSNQKALQAAQANRIRMQTSVQQIKDEAKTVRSFSDRYRKLAVDGIISDEDRLELVETVGRIRTRHNLYPVQLDIEQQAMLPLGQDGGPENSGNGVSLRASRIQIGMPLLHEEDLSHLLDELNGLKRGIFVVEQCSIKRTGGDIGNDRPILHGNLTASCKILWLTLKREGGDGGQDNANKIQETTNR